MEDLKEKRIQEIRARLRKDQEEFKKNRIPILTEFWDNHKPFKYPDDIPDIPILETPELYERIVIKNLIRCGAIPKNKLEVGKTYIGTCRNTEEATWNGNEFDYKRYKWGMWEDDTINHFQDDDGYDVFVPIRLKEE